MESDVNLDHPRPQNTRTLNDYCHVNLQRSCVPDFKDAAAVIQSKNSCASYETAKVHRPFKTPTDKAEKQLQYPNISTVTGQRKTLDGKLSKVQKAEESQHARLFYKENPIVVTSQPIISDSPSPSTTSTSSLTCRRCGKCRCTDCLTSQSLDKRASSLWLCNESLLCSTRHLVDLLSCYCCLKACAYHVTGSDVVLRRRRQCCRRQFTPPPSALAPMQSISFINGDSGEGQTKARLNTSPVELTPWPVGQTRRVNVSSPEIVSYSSLGCAARWTLLGLASLALPCLWCYWPLRSCEWCIERAYEKCTNPSKGCVCPETINQMKQRWRDEGNQWQNSRLHSRNLPPPV